MAGFLYCLPGVKDTSNAVKSAMADHGAVFKDASLEIVGVGGSGGPDGGSGVIAVVAPESANGKGKAAAAGYYPGKQTWIDAGKFWLGIEKDNPPRLDDLQRSEIVQGYLFLLGDGHEWHVPLVRSGDDLGNIPERLMLGPGGTMIREPVERYLELCGAMAGAWSGFKLSSGWLDEEEANGIDPVGKEEVLPLAVQGLGCNYRVGREEVLFLGLLTTTSARDVVLLMFDYPNVQAVHSARLAASKKKSAAATPDGSDISGGETD